MRTLVDFLVSWTFDGKIAVAIFPFLVVALLFVSLRMTKWAEALIARTKFGGGFVGGTLVAMVTSAPELVTEITQALNLTPENGLGDDIGSNAFSLFLLAIGAMVFIRSMFMNKFDRWTKIAFVISLGLTLLLMAFLTVNRIYGFADIDTPYLGIIPAIFFAIYIIFTFFHYNLGQADEPNPNNPLNRHTVHRIVIHFVLWSLLLVAVAVVLNIDVDVFQVGLGIGSESIGGVFLAITTSMPEIVAYFYFLRKKQPIAAVASIVGSHFFNLAILFFGDLSYTSGPTFNLPAMSAHLPLTVITAIMMLILVVNFLFAKKFKSFFNKKWAYLIAPTSISLVYIVGWALILALWHS